jgi:hypothetical protein
LLYQPEYQALINGFKYGLTKSNMLKILRSGELIKTPEYWRCQIDPEDPDADVPTIESASAALAEIQKTHQKRQLNSTTGQMSFRVLQI